MPRVIFKPMDKECEVPRGATILAAARACGAGLSWCCGGNAICGTCQVIVESGVENLSEMSSIERDLLNALRFDPRCNRLGCQARIMGDAVVVIPGLLLNPLWDEKGKG